MRCEAWPPARAKRPGPASPQQPQAKRARTTVGKRTCEKISAPVKPSVSKSRSKSTESEPTSSKSKHSAARASSSAPQTTKRIPPKKTATYKRYQHVISLFTKRQQRAIKRHINDRSIQLLLKKADECIDICKSRNIKLINSRLAPPRPILFSAIGVLSFSQPEQQMKLTGNSAPSESAASTNDVQMAITYFAKTIIFFTHMHTHGVSSHTGRLHDMFRSTRNKSVISDLIDQDNDWLKQLASNPLLISIGRMARIARIPSREKVYQFLQIPCLKQGWQPCLGDKDVAGTSLDKDIASLIVSMQKKRGIPSGKNVREFLTAPCLREGWLPGIENQAISRAPLDRELLESISAMQNYRGLPDRAALEELLSLPCLAQGWQPGVPALTRTTPIDQALLTNIAALQYARGLPTEKAVKEFLTAPCLRTDWLPGSEEQTISGAQLNRDLLKQLAKLFRTCCLPDHESLTAILSLPCLRFGWQPGMTDANLKCVPVSLETISRVTTLRGKKKISCSASSCALIEQMLTQNTRLTKQGAPALRHATVPSADTLENYQRQIEAILSPFFQPHGQTIPAQELKNIATICAGIYAQLSDLQTLKTFMEQHDSTPAAALELLQNILRKQGLAGVKLWLEMMCKKPDAQPQISSAIIAKAPLAVIRFAMTELPQEEWQECITSCRNLSDGLTREKWQASAVLRRQCQRLRSLKKYMRDIMELFWPYHNDGFDHYASQLPAIMGMVLTVGELYKINAALNRQAMKKFLDACLRAGQAREQEQCPTGDVLNDLLDGLLVAGNPLSLPEFIDGDIPQECFDLQVLLPDTDNHSVQPTNDSCHSSELSGEKKLCLFLVIMMLELAQTEYQYNGQILLVQQQNGLWLKLPRPEFKVLKNGFAIVNWTKTQLHNFFQATTFSGQIQAEDNPLDESLAPQAEPMINPEKKTHSLMPQNTIAQIIRYRLSLKPRLWEALKHYADKGNISSELRKLLVPVIANPKFQDMIPESVRHVVKYGNPVSTSTPMPMPTPEQPSQKPQVQDKQEEIFDPFLTQLPLTLADDDLAQLTAQRTSMSYQQLKVAYDKISYSCDYLTQAEWLLAMDDKRRELEEEPLPMEDFGP